MTAAALIRLSLHHSRSALRLPEWRALLLALTTAITLATLLAVLGARLEHSLNRQSAALLGADLSLQSSRPASAELLAESARLGLNTAQVIQFPTMLATDDRLLLVALRAVEPPYPLRGDMVTEPPLQGTPAPGTLWAEPSVLERLNLQPGATLQLGYAELTLSARLLSSPDRGSGFTSLNPQIVINRSDLERTGLLGPGARVRYRQLFSGEPEAIAALTRYAEPLLLPGERLSGIGSDEQGVRGNALGNAARYLRLGALLSLMIAALTIALALRRYSQSSRNRAAVLLSLGLSARQLVFTLLLQLLLAWGLCAALGTLAAVVLEQAALPLLRNLLPAPLPTVSAALYGSGAALGLGIMIALGLPPSLALSRTPVMHLLGGRSATSGANRTLYLAAAGLLLWLLAAYLQNLTLALLLLLVLLPVSAVLGYLGAGLLQLLAHVRGNGYTLARLLRLRLNQQRRWHRLQIPVISLLLALIAVAIWSRVDLLQRWQASLPADTPNHFLVNIQPHEQAAVAAMLRDNGVQATLYPMIRGRITAHNGTALTEVFTPEQQRHNALNRELNLTWAEQLPAHNKQLAGQWQPTEQPLISVEEELATTLDLQLGETLSFTIGSYPITARISSIRRVKWDSFQPNFYVIFSPGALDNMPVSYITSYYADTEQRAINQMLLSRFPTLTLIEIEQLLQQARALIANLGNLSALVMGLTLISGLILLFTTLRQELEQRRYENALLQTLGASAPQCRMLDQLELGLLGLVCGVLAAILSELALWQIHQRLVLIEPVLHPGNWILLPLSALLLFLTIGALARPRVDERNSYRLLRELKR